MYDEAVRKFADEVAENAYVLTAHVSTIADAIEHHERRPGASPEEEYTGYKAIVASRIVAALYESGDIAKWILKDDPNCPNVQAAIGNLSLGSAQMKTLSEALEACSLEHIELSACVVADEIDRLIQRFAELEKMIASANAKPKGKVNGKTNGKHLLTVTLTEN